MIVFDNVSTGSFHKKEGRSMSTASTALMTETSSSDSDRDEAGIILQSRACIALLNDNVWEQVLRFTVADLALWKNVRAANHQLLAGCKSPVSWMGTNISIPAHAMKSKDSIKQILQLASSWGLAKNVCLPAHPKRKALQCELQKVCPSLDFSVAASGPHLLFVMGCRMAVGESMGLHFFEPRYRWMCERIVAGKRPHMFAFVTQGAARAGSTGVLCEVTSHNRNFNGTFDVHLVARETFALLEVWPEEVPDEPHAPPLAVGLVDLDKPFEDAEGSTPFVSIADNIRVLRSSSRHRRSARLRLVSRISDTFRWFAGRFRCCRPRRQ
jgi:hypothetical protein